ncbi:hypothetical protein [Actinoplanes sp. GCM10030250]|uniref:hypothetical protein n=1 Tax=Actinoplanes sp. GCM10030250 TaxID=3273376 RepID=UPI00361F252D
MTPGAPPVGVTPGAEETGSGEAGFEVAASDGEGLGWSGPDGAGLGACEGAVVTGGTPGNTGSGSPGPDRTANPTATTTPTTPAAATGTAAARHHHRR